MTYDFRNIAKQAGAKAGVYRLAPMYMPAYNEATLYQLLGRVLKVWQDGLGQIEGGYESALSAIARDGYIKDNGNDDLSAAVLAVDAAATSATVSLIPLLEAWAAKLNDMHVKRWASIVRSRTKVDPWPYINLSAFQPEIDAFRRDISSLISNVSDTVRKDVEGIVWRGVRNNTRYREVAKEIAARMQVARSRAAFIASDQSNKLYAKLTELRSEEAGLDKYTWRTAKDDRVRPHHAALEGKVFSYKRPPSIGNPGEEPRCRCSAAVYLEI